MLLTIPWFLIIIAGRVDIDPDTGKLQYKAPKLTPPNKLNLYSNGVAVAESTKKTAYLVILTSVSYFVIEGAALYLRNVSDDVVSADEFPYAIAAFVICIALLILYLVLAYNESTSDDAQAERDEYLTEGLKSGAISLVAVVKAITETTSENATIEPTEQTSLVTPPDDKTILRLKAVLRPFFDKYDADSSKTIDKGELALLLKDLKENIQSSFVADLYSEFFADGRTSMDYDIFVKFCLKYSTQHAALIAKCSDASKAKVNSTPPDVEADNEVEDMPEDLISLTPEEQQYNIKMRAFWMMSVGTVIVLIFSDALVSCLSELGDRIGVRPFYVAFILAPFISNGSELVASYNYASKKTSKSIGISMATLLGAAVMNNTFVLAVFMILIFAKVLTIFKIL